MDTNTVTEMHVSAGMQFVEVPPTCSDQLRRQPVRCCGRRPPLRYLMKRTTPIDPQASFVARTLHADISQIGIINQWQ